MNSEVGHWFQIALDIAEYRNSHYAGAKKVMRTADQAEKDAPHVACCVLFWYADFHWSATELPGFLWVAMDPMIQRWNYVNFAWERISRSLSVSVGMQG